MIKLVIFDWDDVFVIGAIQGYFACYEKALADVGVTLEQAELHHTVRGMWGQPHQLILDALLGKGRHDLLAKATEQYRLYKKSDIFMGQLEFVPQGQEFLRHMSAKYQLAIATSQQRDLLVERIFPKFDVPDVFTEIISSDDVKDPLKAKPHPYMIQYLLEKCSVKAGEAVMVGDATNDVLMARSAGVEPVVVLTGHLDRSEAEALGVEHIIDTVTLLEPELKKIANSGMDR